MPVFLPKINAQNEETLDSHHPQGASRQRRKPKGLASHRKPHHGEPSAPQLPELGIITGASVSKKPQDDKTTHLEEKPKEEKKHTDLTRTFGPHLFPNLWFRPTRIKLKHVQLEIEGHDMQTPTPKPLSIPRKAALSKQPSLPPMLEEEEALEDVSLIQEDHEMLLQGLKTVLDCHSLGIPIQIRKRDFVPGRVARPVFHCERCMEHWLRQGNLPQDCTRKASHVAGPEFILTNRTTRLIRSLHIRREQVHAAKVTVSQTSELLQNATDADKILRYQRKQKRPQHPAGPYQAYSGSGHRLHRRSQGSFEKLRLSSRYALEDDSDIGLNLADEISWMESLERIEKQPPGVGEKNDFGKRVSPDQRRKFAQRPVPGGEPSSRPGRNVAVNIPQMVPDESDLETGQVKEKIRPAKPVSHRQRHSRKGRIEDQQLAAYGDNGEDDDGDADVDVAMATDRSWMEDMAIKAQAEVDYDQWKKTESPVREVSRTGVDEAGRTRESRPLTESEEMLYPGKREVPTTGDARYRTHPETYDEAMAGATACAYEDRDARLVPPNTPATSAGKGAYRDGKDHRQQTIERPRDAGTSITVMSDAEDDSDEDYDDPDADVFVWMAMGSSSDMQHMQDHYEAIMQDIAYEAAEVTAGRRDAPPRLHSKYAGWERRMQYDQNAEQQRPSEGRKKRRSKGRKRTKNAKPSGALDGSQEGEDLLVEKYADPTFDDSYDWSNDSFYSFTSDDLGEPGSSRTKASGPMEYYDSGEDENEDRQQSGAAGRVTAEKEKHRVAGKKNRDRDESIKQKQSHRTQDQTNMHRGKGAIKSTQDSGAFGSKIIIQDTFGGYEQQGADGVQGVGSKRPSHLASPVRQAKQHVSRITADLSDRSVVSPRNTKSRLQILNPAVKNRTGQPSTRQGKLEAPRFAVDKSGYSLDDQSSQVDTVTGPAQVEIDIDVQSVQETHYRPAKALKRQESVAVRQEKITHNSRKADLEPGGSLKKDAKADTNTKAVLQLPGQSRGTSVATRTVPLKNRYSLSEAPVEVDIPTKKTTSTLNASGSARGTRRTQSIMQTASKMSSESQTGRTASGLKSVSNVSTTQAWKPPSRGVDMVPPRGIGGAATLKQTTGSVQPSGATTTPLKQRNLLPDVVSTVAVKNKVIPPIGNPSVTTSSKREAQSRESSPETEVSSCSSALSSVTYCSTIESDTSRQFLPNLDSLGGEMSILAFTPAYGFSFFPLLSAQKIYNDSLLCNSTQLAKLCRDRSSMKRSKMKGRKGATIAAEKQAKSNQTSETLHLAKKMQRRASNPNPITRFLKKREPKVRSAPKPRDVSTIKPQLSALYEETSEQRVVHSSEPRLVTKTSSQEIESKMLGAPMSPAVEIPTSSKKHVSERSNIKHSGTRREDETNNLEPCTSTNQESRVSIVLDRWENPQANQREDI